MVRIIHFLQSEIVMKYFFRKKASAESHSTAPESDPRDDDFEFSVAEGVSTAQNAFPDTHIGGNENGQKANGFTVEELTLLKTVDTTDNEMMEIYSENRENNKILDEIEQYVIRKFLVVTNLNNLTFSFRYGTRSRSKGTLDLKTCHKFND